MSYILVFIGFSIALIDVLFWDKPDDGYIVYFLMKGLFWTFLSVMVIQFAILAVVIVPAYILYRLLTRNRT